MEGRRGEHKREEKRPIMAQGSQKKVAQAPAVAIATVMGQCAMERWLFTAAQ